MNFGRDAKAIHKHLKGRGMALSDNLGDPIKYIESMTSLLRGNENVIDYIPCPPNLINTLFLVTDSKKILFSEVSSEVTKGMLFDKTEHFYASNFYTLTSLHEEETIIETRKGEGIFGAVKDEVIIFFDEGSLALSLKKGTGKETYKAILDARKKLLPKPEKPKPATKTAAKSTTKKAEEPAKDSDAIQNIRKMYEDGIINKAEMMELLKAHLSK